MKCGGCVRAVEQRLLGQPGVRQASVNLLTRTAWVDVVSAEASQAALLHSLAGLGFQARLRPSDAELPSRRQRLQSQNWWQHWRQLVVALGLLLVSVLGHLSLAGLGALWIHALVATLTLAGPGRPILVRGVQAALAGLPSMDTLVGLGVISAYLASLVAFLWPQTGWPCFFNEPVMLLGFVLLGRFLEERARFRTGRALEELAELQPDTALLLLGEGPPRPVRVGGLRPGDRVPVDGVVRQGSGAVDVSGLTGEPLPLAAIAGTELSAGSLNLDAPLVLEVLRRGADSAIARIIHLVERAQARKAPIQGLADRLAGRFTLVVLALALATLLFWWLLGTQLWPQVLQPAPLAGAHGTHAGHPRLAVAAETPFALALQLSIAVLVVACPCALGLATPTAITVAMGRAARGGLLFRGGDAIETAAGLRAMLFDKTGTLTRGRPLVTAVEPLQAASSDRLVQLAASLEAGSRHPLGFALLQEAQRRGLELLPVAEAHSWAGQGVSGRIEGQSLRVGRLAWLEASPSPELLARQALLECQGASVLAVGGEQGVLGLVAAADQPRPDAAGVLTALRGMGLQLGLLSGDRREPVQQLGASLGLAEAELGWELRPEQKLERILQHSAHGALAMVGDGINDAPALAAADLGIAVGTGTQIAQDSAGLVVMGDRLDGIVAALRLARRTMAKVRQNLAWAFGYNLIVLPLAAGVLLPGYGVLLTPPLAALLMALSSITVVVNALLLQDGLQDLR